MYSYWRPCSCWGNLLIQDLPNHRIESTVALKTWIRPCDAKRSGRRPLQSHPGFRFRNCTRIPCLSLGDVTAENIWRANLYTKNTLVPCARCFPFWDSIQVWFNALRANTPPTVPPSAWNAWLCVPLVQPASSAIASSKSAPARDFKTFGRGKSGRSVRNLKALRANSVGSRCLKTYTRRLCRLSAQACSSYLFYWFFLQRIQPDHKIQNVHPVSSMRPELN